MLRSLVLLNLAPGLRRIRGLTFQEPDTDSDYSGGEEDKKIEEGERGDSDSGLTIFEDGYGTEDHTGHNFLEAASAS